MQNCKNKMYDIFTKQSQINPPPSPRVKIMKEAVKHWTWLVIECEAKPLSSPVGLHFLATLPLSDAFNRLQ